MVAESDFGFQKKLSMPITVLYGSQITLIKDLHFLSTFRYVKSEIIYGCRFAGALAAEGYRTTVADRYARSYADQTGSPGSSQM